jgi:hypothetical protein
MLPTKFQFIWEISFRGEDFFFFFLEIDQSEKNCLWWPCLLTDRDKMTNLYRGPFFLEINQSKTRMACGCHVC